MKYGYVLGLMVLSSLIALASMALRFCAGPR